MCGIAGVIAWDDRYRTSRDTLARMSAALAHRGPDGQGLWFNHDAEATPDRPQAALAHRRLAIIDPDPRADQPFTDGRGRWITFNGEIYNFRELRAELKGLVPDYAWRTDCDTEVLLVAYAAWGERCVEHLNGMFAFAVWDENAKSLFLARDRMGQKPLYYAFGGGMMTDLVFRPETPSGRGFSFVAFASELGSLRTLPWLGKGPDPGAVGDYLRWGAIAAPATIYPAISALTPSQSCLFRYRDWIPDTYFDPNSGPGQPVPDAVGTTRHAVERAVERQLVSDVPLGCFLSGGIDSAVVALCMRRAVGYAGRVLTFSIGFDDRRYDETAYAGEVARHLGTEHHVFALRPTVTADLPKLAAAFGEPFADSSALPTHYLARETRAMVKVALSGDGGDELFGGYDRYRAAAAARRVGRLPKLVRSLMAATASRLPGTHPKSRTARLRRFTATLDRPASDRYLGYLRLFDEELLSKLMRRAPATGGLGAPFFYEWLSAERDEVRTALAVDRKAYLPDDLLTKVDRASMLHGLEVRSPFMDHELVRFAAGLTTDQLLKGGPKRMLREAFAADLPAWVFKRRKMGFAVPVGDWFRGELRPMLRDHLFAADSFARGHFDLAVVQRLIDEHESQRVDHAQRLYALLMLELWWRLQQR